MTLNSAKDQTVSFFVSTLTLKSQLDKQHLVVTEKNIDVAIAALSAQVANVNAQLKQTPGNARLRQLANSATPDALRWLAEQQAYTTVFSQKGQLPTAKVRGILLKTQSDADSIVKQLQGGADFAALAKSKSLDTQSGANGGDLGTVYVGQFVTAFDKSVFETQSVDALYHRAVPRKLWGVRGPEPGAGAAERGNRLANAAAVSQRLDQQRGVAARFQLSSMLASSWRLG